MRVLAAGGLLAAGLVLPGNAAAAPPSACTPTKGVMVAVDFTHFGGSVHRGCDPTPTTGLEALQTAGFTPTGTQRYGLAFICRIDGLPTPKADKCVNTPPSTAYWSYWHADPGKNSWTYTTVGASSYHPKAGSVDGWAFGAGKPPSVSPGSVRAKAVAAPPAPPPTRSTAVPARAVTSAVAPQVAASASHSARISTPAQAVRSHARATAPSVVTAPSAATAVTAVATPRIVDEVPVAATSRRGGGSPWPLVLGGSLVAVLGLGGGYVAWLRRWPRPR